jgi:halogenation protein CepH
MEETDVVVVGGGPAGSTVATLVAKAGHRVILLEKAFHPRHSVGESLLPATIHGVCRLLGVWDKIHEAGFVRKRGGVFRWGREEEPWTFSFAMATLGEADYAFQVERARFDEILLRNAEEAGVDVREGWKVLDGIPGDDGGLGGVIAREEDGEDVSIRARFVIDASGNSSRLASYAGKRIYSEFFRNVAVYGYYKGAKRVDPPNSGNIVTSAFRNGWCWFIPLSDELTSVGAVVDRTRAGVIAKDRVAALEEFANEAPLVRDLLSGAERVTDGMYGEVRTRKDWSYSNERLHAPGLLLVGDAACFIDPVFSSGVHLATYAGVLAARTVNTILQDPTTSEQALSEFDRRYRREFSLFYDFLVAFYDMEQEWNDYYWTARKVLATDEKANHAFVRLVAGGASAPADFFQERATVGVAFADMVRQAADRDGVAGRLPESADTDGYDIIRINRERSREGRSLMAQGGNDAPVFDDGLVPSADGLTWQSPQEARVPVVGAETA